MARECGGNVPKYPKFWDVGASRNATQLLWWPANSQAPLSLHSPYRSDKMSRLATPLKLSKRHSPCGIRSLAEGRTLGAHFAETTDVLPFKIIFGLLTPYKAVSSCSHFQYGSRVKGEHMEPILLRCFARPFFIPRYNSVADLNDSV
jgi:hypothetical protein